MVFIARVIEEMTVEETAELLGLKPETVRSRLHRARALIRGKLDRMIGPIAVDAFPFAGWQCEQLAERVMARLFPR
jgi:RNA polymerase sigma-70 factor (ECF subfamily)